MHNSFPCHLAIVATLIFCRHLFAEVAPDPLFSDNAVLQQGMDVPVWGTAAEDEKITVDVAGQHAATVAKDGKWLVKLPKLQAGGPHVLTITGSNTVTARNVLVGEVWLCSGQSNMARTLVPPPQVLPRRDYWEAAAAKADHPQIRQFLSGGHVADTPASVSSGKWVVCTPTAARDFSAVGYFFARDLSKAREVPVGLINASVGATGAACWLSRAAMAANPELNKILERQDRSKLEYPAKLAQYKTDEPRLTAEYQAALEKAKKDNTKLPAAPAPPRDPFTDYYRPAACYNGKIAPLSPYALRGVLWYQGENNSGNAREYRTLFPALIADWRTVWKRDDLPFLFVQLPPRKTYPPEFREVQLEISRKLANTGMVVTTDCIDPEDPDTAHPPNKEPVGTRLALVARGVVYGENIEYSGPQFDRLHVDGKQAVVHFTHAGGLVAKGGELKGFTLAGKDKKFAPAVAKIQDDTVIVTSDQVAEPVYVRFGWENAPDVNFYNQAGLPASPFRTDP